MLKYISGVLIVLLVSCGNGSDLKIANNLFEKQEYEEAIKVYSEYIRLNPADIAALYNRGRAYEESEKYDLAIADFESVLALDEDHVQANMSMAIDLYFRQQDYSAAVKYLDHAVVRGKNNAKAYTLRGKVYHRLGTMDKALKDYNTAINVDPDYADAYYARGGYYLANHIKKKACADFQMAASLDLEDAKKALDKYCGK